MRPYLTCPPARNLYNHGCGMTFFLLSFHD